MVPPHIHQVPIVCLEEENEEVPLQEPQVPQFPHMPQAPFVEGDITNTEVKDALMNFN